MYENTPARGPTAPGLIVAFAAMLVAVWAAGLAGCTRPAVRGAGGEPAPAADALRGTAPVEDRSRTASFALG